jgi:ParB-like chromosome segregation protein Spo0J
MKLDIIPLWLIDFNDNTFVIRFGAGKLLRLNSIREVGLINLPILKEKDGGYLIISGYKRLLACKELGIEEVLSKVYNPQEITNKGCLKIVFYENEERFGDMEKAELLMKFKTLCKLEESELRQDVLSLLGIPQSQKNCEKYFRLAGLEREIKEAFYSQKITLEQAVILSEMPSPSRMEMLERVFLRYKMNTNESREVVKEIQEACMRDKKGIREVIDEIEIKISQGDIKTDSFRRELKLMRYPMLNGVEEEFKGCLKDLNLPKDVTIHHTPFFEGNHVEIRVKIESAKRFSEILSYFESVRKMALIDKLLGIVKEGRQRRNFNHNDYE